MPIRAEYRAFYRSAKWRKFRATLIAAAGGEICAHCRIELARGINAAHLDHDPRNAASVILLCPSCHAHNDARHRIAMIRRRNIRQLWLMEELYWAAMPESEMPSAIRGLFPGPYAAQDEPGASG